MSGCQASNALAPRQHAALIGLGETVPCGGRDEPASGEGVASGGGIDATGQPFGCLRCAYLLVVRTVSRGAIHRARGTPAGSADGDSSDWKADANWRSQQLGQRSSTECFFQ